jgi:hypothetical protein
MMHVVAGMCQWPPLQCIEALTNPAAANKTLSIYGAKKTLGEGQSLNSEITRLFGAI